MKEKEKMQDKDIPEDFTEEQFLKDLEKVCRRIKPADTSQRKKSSGKT